MVFLDVVLMALVSVTIVSFLMWSICTQYRDAGCEHLRVPHRPRVKVKMVSLDEPEGRSIAVRDVRTSA